VPAATTIRSAPYATYGTQELSEHAVKALRGRSAAFWRITAWIAVGPWLSKAMWLAVEGRKPWRGNTMAACKSARAPLQGRDRQRAQPASSDMARLRNELPLLQQLLANRSRVIA